jgi:large repetitive protein
MKKVYYCLILIALLQAEKLSAQLCDPSTPVFSANLSGNPNGTWISPSVVRDGNCCTSTPPDVCIQFNLTLDSAAVGINFNIASGAVPPGALYYQINCGPPVAVGQPICLSGAGPHILTFCKPGNNQNTYAITSIGEPAVTLNVDRNASPLCKATLTASGVPETNLTWTSVPFNTTYNSYLSCTTGCDTVSVTPTGSFPAYVDYMVCANAVGPCATDAACDTVRVYFLTDVNITVSPTNLLLCNGVSTTTINATATGGAGSYQYLWSNGQTGNSITVGAGSYTVTATDSVGCAPATATSVINVLPPIVANAGNDVTVCANQATVNLNGSIQTATAALWTGGSGTFNPNNAALNATYIPSTGEIANGFVNLVLQTTANQGCPADYDTIHITIVQPPSPVISGNMIACANSTASYSVPLVAGCSYAWTVNGGTIMGSSTSNSINVTWGGTATASVSVTMTNSYSCSATDTRMISIVVLPNPAITGSGTSCQYSTSTYSVIASTGSTYLWTVTNGTIVGSNTNSSVQVNWNTFGTGTVTVKETNSYGCIQATSKMVAVAQQPVATISGDLTGCFNTLTTNYTAPAATNTSYAWSVSGGIINGSSSTNSINVTWGTGSGSVTVTMTNSAGCTTTATQTVSIGMYPSPVVSGSNATCQFSQTNYTVNGTSGSTYVWTVTNGTILGSTQGTSVQVNWNLYGSGTITVTETNAYGCTQTNTLPVSISQQPMASISGILTGCLSSLTTNYTAPSSTNCTYAWSVNGGIINGSSSANTINVTWPNGTGSIIVTMTNPSGCTSTATESVSIGINPTPIATGANSNCQFSATNYSVNTTPGSIYEWSANNGTILGSSQGSSVQVAWNSYGAGNITLTELNSYGCSATYTMPVTIFQQPIPVIGGSATGCLNNSGSTYTSPVISNTNYSWSVDGGIILSANGSNTVNVMWTSGSNNSVTLTVSNSNGCDSTITFPVTVAALTPPSVQASTLSGCPPLNIAFSGNEPATGQIYNWTFGDNLYSSTANPSHTYNTTGTYNVTVITTNGVGCADTANTSVHVYDVPQAAFNHNYETETYIIGESELQISNTTIGGTNYFWSFGTSDTSVAFEPIHIYTTPGEYTIDLITTNQHNCMHRTSKEITVRNRELLYLPNAFTPNGDNMNDYFSLHYSNITAASVSIFNRWGQKIFTSEDKDFKWDGNFNGHAVELGVYVYKVKATGEAGKEYTMIGSVTLVR